MAETTIITGQFVRISQAPASIGERIVARAIDYIVVFFYIWAVSYFLFGLLNIRFSGFSYILFIAAVYLPAFCYSLLCEVFNNGQSIGKRVLNIRVVKANGTTPTLGDYFLRWLLFLVDGPITGGMGILVILLTKNSQRLGDLAAGTMVIKENNYKKIQVSLDEFNHLTLNYKPVFPQAADLSLEQINVITKTLTTKNKLRNQQIAILAKKIKELLSITQATPSNERFLYTIIRDYQYYAMEIV